MISLLFTYTHTCKQLQSVRDLVINGLGITDLSGLENLANFGDELAIVNNQYLVTLRQLGANLPSDYRTTVQNLGIRFNPLLVDVDGFRYIQNIEGMHDRLSFHH